MFSKFAIYLFSAAIVLTYTPPSARADQPLRVGATLPLTGDYSFIGAALQHGMQLALKDLPPDQIKIWYEDEGGVDRAKAVTGFQKLVSTDDVQVVLGSTVNTVTAYAPIAARKKIPVVSLWDSNASIDGLGEYAFSIGVSTERAGEKMARYAFHNLKISKLAIISAHDEWSDLIAEAFSQQYKSLGGEVVTHESIAMVDSDVRSVITKIKKGPAQAIYAPLYLNALHAVIRQSKELGFSGKILSADSMVDSDAKLLAEAAEGVLLTQIWLDTPAFLQKYKMAFGEEASPFSLSLASLGYDSIMMLAQAQSKLLALGKPITPQTIRDILPETDFKGVSTRIKFDGKRSISQEENIVRVHAGKFEKVLE